MITIISKGWIEYVKAFKNHSHIMYIIIKIRGIGTGIQESDVAPSSIKKISENEKIVC